MFSACYDRFGTTSTEDGIHRATLNSHQVVIMRFEVEIMAGMRRFPVDVMLRWAPCHLISVSRYDNCPFFSPLHPPPPHTHTHRLVWVPRCDSRNRLLAAVNSRDMNRLKKKHMPGSARYTFRRLSSLRQMCRALTHV